MRPVRRSKVGWMYPGSCRKDVRSNKSVSDRWQFRGCTNPPCQMAFRATPVRWSAFSDVQDSSSPTLCGDLDPRLRPPVWHVCGPVGALYGHEGMGLPQEAKMGQPGSVDATLDFHGQRVEDILSQHSKTMRRLLLQWPDRDSIACNKETTP